MGKVQIQTEIDIQKLLSQLETSQLEEFLREIRALITRRKSKDTQTLQLKLLQKLNEECVLTESHKEKFRQLTAKRETTELTANEQKELSKRIKEEESLRLKRINILGELAQLKGISLPELTKELGIYPSESV